MSIKVNWNIILQLVIWFDVANMNAKSNQEKFSSQKNVIISSSFLFSDISLHFPRASDDWSWNILKCCQPLNIFIYVNYLRRFQLLKNFLLGRAWNKYFLFEQKYIFIFNIYPLVQFSKSLLQRCRVNNAKLTAWIWQNSDDNHEN